MVPLEVEREDASGVAGGAGVVPTGSAAAPISALSRLAFKDALLQLEATVRKTRDVSSAAMLQLWQVAEKHLGVEVEIEDPALRGLFGVHVLAVEELCNRVRTQAEATSAAVDLWSQPQVGITAAGMRLLGDLELGDGRALDADLVDADVAAAEARARLCARLQAEVLEALDARLRQHVEVREVVRQRQRWGAYADAARRDVAWLRKESHHPSGLAPSLRSSGPLEQAEVRLREASEQVSLLDGRLLGRLTELQEDSVAAVQRPWAALMQIQSEFFMAQQAIWAPLAATFQEFAVGPAAIAGSRGA
uniref:Uncharacterized protein n=1 Tax=Pyrodinium bahamense TaxID=73915 RepID=A0A7S0AD48_9DINO|mmetsp:Transcript_31781/g.87480  ORF Transcript_31781/g.87480 Transcript_31781/m.87480 type:complete len:306 (+) Transcript_31781:62-979(+)